MCPESAKCKVAPLRWHLCLVWSTSQRSSALQHDRPQRPRNCGRACAPVFIGLPALEQTK
eukprot:8915489-Alexandrium_andersonii.AAC.1